MSPLAGALRQRIGREGPISLASFMAAALTDPAHGYYMTRDPLGGDFTTAPEISQMFGELLGAWTIDAWERLGRPAPFALVELGPGRGTLMADLLRVARLRPDFATALRLHLVEASPVLRRAQAARLAAAAPAWCDRLDEVPDLPLLLLANEFFDALPVRQFERRAEGWRERLVAWDEAAGTFTFAYGPALGSLAADAPIGSLAEHSPAAAALAGAIGRRLAARPGAALVIDYGYRGPALGDSLQALRRGRPAPVLEAPGEADLTAHVDFTALAAAAEAAGAIAHGPVGQGAFLARLGLAARAAALKARAAPAQAVAIDLAVDRLAAPLQMGRLFQVLGLGSPGLGPLAGFAEGA